MPRDKHPGQAHREERGMTLVMVAFALVALLGFAALAIDLAFLYVGRSEAQRAADAAALAGAKEFADSGFASGVISQAAVKPLATQAAEAVGAQNFVGGQPAVILDSDVTFDFSIPNDPRITVTVARDANHPGGPLPTFFAKVFGVLSANVSAKATAEAYSPGATGPPVGTTCLKPWMLPNCDPTNSQPPNTSCPGSNAAKFVDPNDPICLNTSIPGICHPGPVSQGGVIGALLSIKPGDPTLANAPSKYYPVFLPPGPPGTPPPLCPSCASGGGGSGIPSGSLYRQNIECCNQDTSITSTCGSKTVTPITGNMVGPTAQGVDCLIHESGGTGQDIMDPNTLQITGGLNNPNPLWVNQPNIKLSDSIVTIPLYEGQILCPGLGGCSATVTVVGFLQLFLKEETSPQGTVNAYIMNVSGCGSGGSGPGSPPPPITSTSRVPIRLIRNP